VNASSFQLRKQLFNLSITNKGIATNQRDVQRLVTIDKRENSTNELLTLEVGELTQLNRATQMRGIKCIASRTAKWTLLRNLNGD
jgi:hypothetical protein